MKYIDISVLFALRYHGVVISLFGLPKNTCRTNTKHYTTHSQNVGGNLVRFSTKQFATQPLFSRELAPAQSIDDSADAVRNWGRLMENCTPRRLPMPIARASASVGRR
jgi:hypothetical protein